MTPIILRQLWFVVETTQANTLWKLDDASLVQWLLKQIKMQSSLDHNEINVVSDYIKSRLTLIRDMAQDRQSYWQHTQS